MSVTLKREWFGESGYCNCLLVAMSRASIGKLELLSNQPVPNLEALVSRSDTHAWLRTQEFNYLGLDASKVIGSLAGLAGISKSFWRYKADSTGSILVHDCVGDDGQVVERHFHLRLRRAGSVLSLTVMLNLSATGAPAAKQDTVNAGPGLRWMILTTSPKEFGAKPTKEFSRVYAILIDWPIGDQIATVFSSSTGAASLYTTSTFGIIGGEGHEKVRAAAKSLVKAADRHFTTASPTTEFPYPREGHVRFYLLTFDGVRVIDTDLASITNGTSRHTELFELGQAVLTELRLVTERQ